MRKVFVLLLILAIMAPSTLVFGAEWKKKKVKADRGEVVAEKKKSKYDELLKKPGVVTACGKFVTVHKIGEKIYFEYPLEYTGREVLFGCTVSATSDPLFVNVGYKYKTPLHLQITLQDSIVSFCKPNVNASGGSDEAWVKKAMERNYIPNLYKQFPVAAYNADSTAVVFEVTSLLNNNPDLSPEGREGIFATKLVKEGSSFGKIKAFDDNISVEVNQPVSLDYEFSMFRGSMGKFSTRSVLSMLLLPEEKMMPRVQDSRIGIFPTQVIYQSGSAPMREISQKEDGLRAYMLANRWRLEPKDVEAWKRGELVEPVKPIVWYVDDAFPEEWKAPIKAGILTWNKAFEKIGLKNAIVALDFPVADSTFDPDNLKYSCVRYSPSATANAMGPSWVDPTTGEIINASVIVYNDIIKLINNWRFVQTAQVDPRVRAKKMPRDVVDESITYIIAHEIGHTLGMMHNMAASAAIPVDSLRSASFTRKYGTTMSIMDYARFNYVAQPGDEGVKLTPPDLGVYDYYTIKWLYTPQPGVKDMWEAAALAEKWIDEKAGDPCYRYGRQQLRDRYDPSSIEEDLGDDPVKASSYGIKNLKYILRNINQWIDNDENLTHRNELYTQIQQQYLRYIINVMYQVGGIYLTQVKDGTAGEPVKSVDRKKQKEALAWVIHELRGCDWIDAPELSSKLGLKLSASSDLAAAAASYLFAVLPTNVTLSAHVSKEKDRYTIREYFDDLYAGIFAPTVQGRKLTENDKLLQRSIMFSGLKAAGSGGGAMITLQDGSQFDAAKVATYPSLDEIVAYDLDPTGATKSCYSLLREIEERFGRGSVASALLFNRFGESSSMFQDGIFVDNIHEIDGYSILFVKKVRALLKGKVASAHPDDKAHYESLLLRLDKFFK